jgi:type I restriction enzyme S subunit
MRKAWEIKKLGEVADYFIGLTYSPKDVSDQGTIVLRSSNIQNGKLDFSDIVRVKRPIKESLKVKNGDILMCSRNGSKRLVGKTATIQDLKEEMTFGTFMTVIRSQCNSYLSWFFISDEFREQIGGGDNPMINQITKYMLDDVKVPLPPLSEQKRIVEILDETFAAIDKAKANIEKNLQNAKELFESEKVQIFKSIEDFDDKVPISSVCDEIFAGGDAPKQNFSLAKTEKYKIPIIANAVENNGLYGYTDLIRVNRPSITIAARGSGTGHTEIRNEPFFPIVRVIVLIPKGDLVNLKFLKYSIQNLNILRSGSAIPQLTVPMIKEYSIPLPNINKQQEIVGKLDALQAEIKKLEAIYQQKLNDLEELKKTILQKTFNGELITATNKNLVA